MADKMDSETEEVWLCLCNCFGIKADSMQRLKAALWFSIGKIVDEESLKLGVNATPQFIGALTEMVWSQTGIAEWNSFESTSNFYAEGVAQDLENFAKHAGRTTVTTDDVLLITRRNDALHDIMKDFIDNDKAGTSKGNRRK
jgi:centromere protein S